ncbi:MAG: hypothetical protein Q9191_008241 [Dirinaria sp. TL-2023a]
MPGTRRSYQRGAYHPFDVKAVQLHSSKAVNLASNAALERLRSITIFSHYNILAFFEILLVIWCTSSTPDARPVKRYFCLDYTMATIVEGQKFPSLQSFKEALREWAVEKNFTPHILDSDRTRVRAGCRSAPDCPFKIRVNHNSKLGYARVTTVEDVHTCAASTGQLVPQNIKRAETAKVSFLVKAIPQLLEVTKSTSVSRIVEVVEEKYGQKIADRQAQKVKRLLCSRPCRYCHQLGHSVRCCPQRPAQLNPDEVNGADAEADSDPGEWVNRRVHCQVCSKTGHNRKNCPDSASIDPASQDVTMIEEQLKMAAYAPALPPNPPSSTSVPVDPQIEDNEPAPAPRQLSVSGGSLPSNRSMDGSSGLPNSLPSRPSSEPRPLQQAINAQLARPTPHQNTPQNPKLEAARLMQQAARLMQEAARLNFEAARLTASAVD